MKFVIAKGNSRLTLTDDGWKSDDENLLQKAKAVTFNPYELTYAGSIIDLYVSQVARAVKGEIVETDEKFDPSVIY